MQFAAVLNVIVMLTSALQGVFNLVGASVPVSEIIKDHILNGDNKWTEDQRNQIVSAMDKAFVTADAQITAAGAPPSGSAPAGT